MQRRATIAACVAILVALDSLTACSKKKDEERPAASGMKTPTAAPTITFTVDGGVDANGTKAPDDTILTQVKETLDAYLGRGVITPLFTGEPAGDLSDLFTTEAQARLSDAATRATLVEEGLPPASTSITADAVTVKLSSVAGPDGVVALVAARLDVKLHAVGPRIDIDVVRDGEIVLAPQDGRWRIDSFGVRATRNTRDSDSATTTTSGASS